MEVTVRRANSNEKRKCDEVLRSAFLELVRQLGRELSDASFADLGEAIDEGRVMVGTKDSAIVAAATFLDEGSFRVIEHVGVEPHAQGGGIGTKVLEAIERNAAKGGIVRLRLNTVEFAKDLVLLYTKLGYQIVSKGPPKHGRDSYSRVFMEKDISSLAI